MNLTSIHQLLLQQQMPQQTMQQQQHPTRCLEMQQYSSSHSFQACRVLGHSFWAACRRQLAAVQGGTVCTVSSLAGSCQLDIWRALMMQQPQHLQEMLLAAAMAAAAMMLLLLLRVTPLLLLVLLCV
jgi:hypothetical protein